MKIKGKWKKYELVPVYERCDGLRIHLLGLIKKTNNTAVKVDRDLLKHFLKITGGNTRRAMMLTANEMVKL